MKKKIVITLEKKGDAWYGYIQGIVDQKRTCKIEIEKPLHDKTVLIDALTEQLILIEKWMEQIS